MLALTPVDLDSVAVIGASCGDFAVGVGATLMEIASDKPDLVVHPLVLTGGGTEREVEEKNAFITLLAQCYPSQSRQLWFDDEAFVGLMRVRGVQCKARYAEAFAVENAVSDVGSDYSVN